MLKNVILVDCEVPDDWEFRKAIEYVTEEKWIVECNASNRKHGSKVKNLIRYIQYFIVPLQVFLNIKKYSHVLAWQQFYGLILAFYCRLFRIKKTSFITVMTFIYKPKMGVYRLCYEKFVKYCLQSNHIYKVIVFSEKEKEYYAHYFNISAEKFEFVKLGIEDTTKRIPMEKAEDYCLAVGRSNRDYSFLLSVWDKNKPLKIICDSLKVKDMPPNIEILDGCYGDDYLKCLSRCSIVIVPLQDENISSGQLVILQAMMYGKPVVITKNNAVEDYIQNGINGFVIRKTQADLKNAVSKIENNYLVMSNNARKYFEEKFSLYEEGREVGKIILSI